VILKICAKIINKFKKIAFSPETLSLCKKSPSDFTRKRKLCFQTLILFLINFVKSSLQNELDQFFKVFLNQNLPDKYVASSALCEARKKLKVETFPLLGKLFVDMVYQHLNINKWKGLRLVATDGTTIKLPDVSCIREHFGGQGNSLNCFTPMAKVLALYDPLNKFTLASTFNPYKSDERFQLFESLNHLTSGDLLLLDRGFPAFWLFSALNNRSINFVCRLPIHKWKIAQELIQSGKREAEVTLQANSKNKRTCLQLELPTDPITLRIIRVDLENAEPEILITTLLDNSRYPASDFDALYRQRWFIEEDFKVIKKRLIIESFPGFSVDAVTHHFHATMLAKNIAALLWFFPEQQLRTAQTDNKLKYQTNKTLVLSKMKDTLILIFTRSCKFVDELITDLLHILLKCTSPIRPGRSFVRKKNRKSGVHMKYKPIR